MKFREVFWCEDDLIIYQKTPTLQEFVKPRKAKCLLCGCEGSRRLVVHHIFKGGDAGVVVCRRSVSYTHLTLPTN